MDKTHGNSASVLTALLSVLFVVNPLSHMAQNLLGLSGAITYYVGYLSWLSLFIYFFSRKIKVRRRECILAGILLLTFVLGACLWGERCLGGTIQDLHSGVFVCVAILVTMAVKPSVTIREKQLMGLLRIIVLFGLFFSLYAMIVQRENLMGVLRNQNKFVNAWKYTSLFSQRNVFAEYCYLSSFAACFLSVRTKKWRYFLYLLIFAFQVVITNSRAGLLGIVGLLGLTICFRRKKKGIFAVLAILIAVIAAYTLDFPGILLERFSHISSRGMDSGQERLANWRLCVEYVWENHGYLFGFGNNSVSLYLLPRVGYGSSHNAYIDAFFNGGMVYVSILLYLLWQCFREIRAHKSDGDDSFYCVWRAGFLSWAVYCMFEAGISLFTANFFSVPITVLLALIPRLYKEAKSLNT